MAEYVRIGNKNELPPAGEAREFTIGERVICVANVNGTVSALDNVCLHRGGPIGQGVVDGDKIICPWHGWTFHVLTGEAVHNPAAKLRVYPIKVEGDDVLVEI